MATLRVTAERLEVHPHPNADALELAQVGLYRAVIAKGQYRDGDWAIYIPEGALLPDDLIAEFGLTGRLAGQKRNRVKAIRLRGELSQGLVARPTALDGVDLAAAHSVEHNFADELGITKWVPPIPIHLSGKVTAAPDLLPWIEIEDIKRYPAVFDPGELVVATEKVHGTACLFTLVDGKEFVSSKGYGSQHLAIVKDDANLYWRAVLAHNLPEVAAKVASRFDVSRVAVYGEVFGDGLQDLTYGANAKSELPGYAMFDIRIDSAGVRRWLDSDEVASIAAEFGLAGAPLLYAGPYDQEILLQLAVGPETVSGKGVHLREGLVVRPAKERYSNITGGRAIAKFVSPDYLTRKGGTEFD